MKETPCSWMGTPEGVTREETRCFKLSKKVQNLGFVFTVSQENTHPLTVRRSKEWLIEESIGLTISYVSTVLGTELLNVDAQFLVRSVTESIIVRFLTILEF